MIQARLTVTHLKKTGEEPRMFRVNREESFRQWNSPNATGEPAPLTVYHVPNPWMGSKFLADLNKFIEAQMNAGVSRGLSWFFLSSEAPYTL